MDFVTCRRRKYLPGRVSEMSNSFWFNMWQLRIAPWKELEVGNHLYWYENES